MRFLGEPARRRAADQLPESTGSQLSAGGFRDVRTKARGKEVAGCSDQRARPKRKNHGREHQAREEKVRMFHRDPCASRNRDNPHKRYAGSETCGYQRVPAKRPGASDWRSAPRPGLGERSTQERFKTIPLVSPSPSAILLRASPRSVAASSSVPASALASFRF